MPCGDDAGICHDAVYTAECPRTSDGRQLFPCVTTEDADVVVCIDEHALCDDVVQCPNGEDEDPTVCMFHRLVRPVLSCPSHIPAYTVAIKPAGGRWGIRPET